MFGWSRHELVDLVLTGARQVTARDQGINTRTVRECQPQPRDKYFNTNTRTGGDHHLGTLEKEFWCLQWSPPLTLRESLPYLSALVVHSVFSVGINHLINRCETACLLWRTGFSIDKDNKAVKASLSHMKFLFPPPVNWESYLTCRYVSLCL